MFRVKRTIALKLETHQRHYFHCPKITSNFRAMRLCKVKIDIEEEKVVAYLLIRKVKKTEASKLSPQIYNSKKNS